MLRLNVGDPADGVEPEPARPRSAATWPGSRTAAASPTTSSTIELRAIAGTTYPLVATTYTPDGAAGLVTEQPDPCRRPLPAGLPLPGNAARRLQHAVAVIQRRRPGGLPPGRRGAHEHGGREDRHARTARTHPPRPPRARSSARSPGRRPARRSAPASSRARRARHRRRARRAGRSTPTGSCCTRRSRSARTATTGRRSHKDVLERVVDGALAVRRRVRQAARGHLHALARRPAADAARDDRRRRGHRARLDRAVAVDDDRCAGPAARPSRGS